VRHPQSFVQQQHLSGLAVNPTPLARRQPTVFDECHQIDEVGIQRAGDFDPMRPGRQRRS